MKIASYCFTSVVLLTGPEGRPPVSARTTTGGGRIPQPRPPFLPSPAAGRKAEQDLFFERCVHMNKLGAPDRRSHPCLRFLLWSATKSISSSFVAANKLH